MAATRSNLCPSPVRSIWQLWIGRYTHIPAVALVTARFRCYSKAAFVGGIFSRLQHFWASSCFLTSTTLLRSLALLYVGKTNCSTISYHMIGCILVLHMNLRIRPRLHVRCSFLWLQMKTLCVAPCKRMEQRESASHITRITSRMHNSTKRYPQFIKLYVV